MKQTAVEWLIEHLTEIHPEAFEQAKQMEKEQIMNVIKLTIEREYYEQTWANCRSTDLIAQQYYNETFKSE